MIFSIMRFGGSFRGYADYERSELVGADSGYSVTAEEL